MTDLTKLRAHAAHPALAIGSRLTFAFVIQVIVTLLAVTVPIIAPAVAKGRDLSLNLLVFYSPILYVSAFCINFLVPKLLARYGGAGLSLFCMAIAAIGLRLMLPASMVSTVAAPIVLGFALGAVRPATSQVLGPILTPRTAGLIMAIRQSALPASAFLAGLVLPLLVVYWGWHALLPIGIVGIGLAILLLPTLPWLNDRSPTPPAVQGVLSPLKRLLAIPGMPQIVFALFVDLMMTQCIKTFFTVYLVKDLRFDLTMAGLVFGALQLAGFVGQFACAIVSDRWLSPRAVLAGTGLTVAAAAIAAARFTPHWPVAAVVLVAAVLGFFTSGSPAVVLGEIARRSPPGQVGIMTSAGNLAIMAGSAIGPLVFGAAATRFGYPGGYVAIAALIFVGAVAVAPLRAPGGPSAAAKQSRR